MKDKRTSVYKLLDGLGIAFRVQEHEAVFTVAESSKILSEKVSVKSLLVREEKGEGVWMVIMRGDKRLDMKLLAHELGVKRIVFVKPENVEPLVGVKPGSVSLFGLLHDGAKHIDVVIDEILMSEPKLGFHPNDNTATVFIRPQDMVRIINQTDHTLQVMSVY